MSQRKVWCEALGEMVLVRGAITGDNPLLKLHVGYCYREKKCEMKNKALCQIGKTLEGRW